MALNIKVTLDDPFVMMSEQAIATGSSNSGCNGTEGVYCYNGGCNDSSCSIEAGVEILGCGISLGGSTTASDSSAFACCSVQCKSYLKSDYYEKSSPL